MYKPSKMSFTLQIVSCSTDAMTPLKGILRKCVFFSNLFHFCVGCFRMSKPAADILQTFYMRLRDRNTSADSTPITARQLESLVRLAEARARVDLREEITAEDAKVTGIHIT